MTTIRAKTRIPLSGVSSTTVFYAFEGLEHRDHFAVRFGEPSELPLVRIHSECVTGDVFGSLRCDCGSQLQNAIGMLDEQSGWLLYLRQEGRGIGLAAKLQAYALQEQGLDTFEANVRLGFAEDARRYHDAAAMLRALGQPAVRLLTDNPEKVQALRAEGIAVAAAVACTGIPNRFNAAYLDAKRERSRQLRQAGGSLAGTRTEA
ncbi:GTP cyclohydrolase II RibA [Pseudorhodoferax sp.]|uniref:GTP cyclohydrolase II RibA n=1 Tax=Pseudorhodoferax sp. TaxID=1993553 RepID=UPI002DD682BC|nr:GTP cyclohydrolase II RibA [Pseudorhodoferax sp.]